MHEPEWAPAGAVAVMYASLRRRDLAGVASSLHPAVVADLAPGLPLGLGGRHRGRDAVLGVWRTVGAAVDVTPEVRSIHGLDDVGIVAFGTYEFVARATRERLSAPFVHRFELDGGHIVHLEQTTDTHLWRVALSTDEGGPA